jgi:hypothetical protein
VKKDLAWLSLRKIPPHAPPNRRFVGSDTAIDLLITRFYSFLDSSRIKPLRKTRYSQ